MSEKSRARRKSADGPEERRLLGLRWDVYRHIAEEKRHFDCNLLTRKEKKLLSHERKEDVLIFWGGVGLLDSLESFLSPGTHTWVSTPPSPPPTHFYMKSRNAHSSSK